MGVATLTPPAQRIGEELVYPDGRHELADDSAIRNSPLYNGDLAPVPIKRRTWTTYNYMALWIGMAHNIPTYLLASGLRSEEHTSELQSHHDLVCRLLLE